MSLETPPPGLPAAPKNTSYPGCTMTASGDAARTQGEPRTVTLYDELLSAAELDPARAVIRITTTYEPAGGRDARVYPRPTRPDRAIARRTSSNRARPGRGAPGGPARLSAEPGQPGRGVAIAGFTRGTPTHPVDQHPAQGHHVEFAGGTAPLRRRVSAGQHHRRHGRRRRLLRAEGRAATNPRPKLCRGPGPGLRLRFGCCPRLRQSAWRKPTSENRTGHEPGPSPRRSGRSSRGAPPVGPGAMRCCSSGSRPSIG